MKRFLWVLALTSAIAACASESGTSSPVDDHPDAALPADGGTFDANALPDAGIDANKRPVAVAPDGSFDAPAPILSAMSPSKAVAGGQGPSLVITGAGFVSWSSVQADGADLPTTFVSETELHALLPSARIADAGVLQIDVFTTQPGGGKSATLGFLVENPMPVLSSIAPASVQVGASDLPIALAGLAFAKTPKVSFDGQDLTVTASTANVITSTIPAAYLAQAGSHAIVVTNPAPGGGASAPISFTVTNPQTVSLTGIAPDHATVGSGDVALTVSGAGFVANSVVSFNGTNISSSTPQAETLQATIPAALLAAAGSYSVVVTNPPPGGGVSNPIQFEVWNPQPALTSLSPNTVYYGGADQKITVLGTGFVPSSTVRLNDVDMTTLFVSSNSLEAIVPAATLATLGTPSVTVRNPAPGGGTSSAVNLFVVCDPTGVDLALGAAGNVTTVFTDFSTAASVSTLLSGTCPVSTGSVSAPQPARAWVVQNNQPTSLTLSAWAVCTTTKTAQDDALLGFYRRPTAPTTDAERLQCTGVLSEGEAGSAGAFTSPEANGSSWCPGLTKGNGGGISLGACERAVVWTQPYSATSAYYTPPSTLRIKIE